MFRAYFKFGSQSIQSILETATGSRQHLEGEGDPGRDCAFLLFLSAHTDLKGAWLGTFLPLYFADEDSAFWLGMRTSEARQGLFPLLICSSVSIHFRLASATIESLLFWVPVGPCFFLSAFVSFILIIQDKSA